MSYCRRQSSDGVYLFMLGDAFMCQICPMHATGGDWIGKSYVETFLHLIHHVQHGERIAEAAIHALWHDFVTDALGEPQIHDDSLA